MLIIHDMVARQYGVKDYLENGTNNDRNRKDKRIPLYGDIDTLDEAIKLGIAMNYKETYKNFVLSFEEDYIPKEILSEISQSFIEQYTAGYEDKEYVAYAESHKQKIKYKKNKDGKLVKRHLHLHISLATYNPHLEKRLELGTHGARKRELELWKLHIEQKYNLKSVTPNPIKSTNPKSKPTVFNRNEIREILNDISAFNVQSGKVKSLDELIKILYKQPGIKLIKKGTDNAITPYITIHFNRADKVRLKGSIYGDKTFISAVQELIYGKGKEVYKESGNVVQLDKPKKLLQLTNLRIKKINDREYKSRIKANQREELTPLLPHEYKEWMKKLEYKNTPKRSNIGHNSDPLAYQIATIKEDKIKLSQSNSLDMETIKKYLDTNLLLDELSKTHLLNKEIYSCEVNKKGEPRIKAGTRKLNVSDFLTKELNMEWKNTKIYLETLYKKQLENNKLREDQKQIKRQQYQQINKMSYQNKIFVNIYKVNANINLNGYYIKHNENNTVVLNKSKDIKIVDNGDEILSLGSNLEEEISLMLDMAIAKKWDLANMEISGNDEFVQESVRQINNRLMQETLDIQNTNDIQDNKEDIEEQKNKSRKSNKY